MKLEEVQVAALTPDRLLPLIGPERAERFETTAAAAASCWPGAAVVNVNSTASGGGVAEMLRTAPRVRAWCRRRRPLGRHPGRPGLLHDHQAHPQHPPRRARRRRPARRQRAPRTTRRCCAPTPRARWRCCDRGDIVLLHDPADRRARRAPSRGAASSVVWRCHVGADAAERAAPSAAWAFLRPYLERRRRLRVHRGGVRARLGRPASARS